ncbi:hypothetical protein ACTPEF_25915, partial [Clostridioides difficile]
NTFNNLIKDIHLHRMKGNQPSVIYITVKDTNYDDSTLDQVYKKLSKNVGEESFYLEKDRAYRDENDVFEHYSLEERNARFGIPPA